MMAPAIMLLKALLRSSVRNRQGMFWTFFFPVLLMVVFGLLGNLGAVHVRLDVTGPPGPMRTAVVRFFRKIPLFSVREAPSAARAQQDVREDRVDAALVVPADPAFPLAPARLQLWYNNANYIMAQQVVAAVHAGVSELNIALTGRPPAVSLVSKPVVGSRQVTYLDFLVPGILAMMAMQTSLFGVAVNLTRWKEKGILRRFLATPLTPPVFLGAVVANQLVFNLGSLAVVLGIAVVFLKVSVAIPVVPLLVTLVLGVAAFLSIAFVVAGRARTTEAAVPIVNLISFPMMFLSGIWFPVSNLPGVLQDLVRWFPLTFLVDGVRGLMSGQMTGFTPALLQDLAGLLGWLVVMAAVSGRSWRWE